MTRIDGSFFIDETPRRNSALRSCAIIRFALHATATTSSRPEWLRPAEAVGGLRGSAAAAARAREWGADVVGGIARRAAIRPEKPGGILFDELSLAPVGQQANDSSTVGIDLTRLPGPGQTHHGSNAEIDPVPRRGDGEPGRGRAHERRARRRAREKSGFVTVARHEVGDQIRERADQVVAGLEILQLVADAGGWRRNTDEEPFARFGVTGWSGRRCAG